jgi:NADPH:quinone reductase-like Zn-dependent oxidoreductase
MHALRAHTRGGPEVLVYEHASTPTAGDGDVLVEVHAAAITFDELSWDETWTRDGKDRTPIIPSHEFSGVIAQTGDEVYGLVPFDRDGAAAEYVSVPASQIAPKPAHLSHVEAAALPLPALTAQQALDRAGVTAGERVLVHGAAGAVGGYATQMASALGAHVTATAVSGIEYVRELGADTVVDVRTEAFDADAAAFDVVIDTVSGDTLDRSYAVLRRGGRLVTLQTPPDQAKADRYGVTAVFFIVATDSDELAKLAHLVDDSRLRVTISRTFPLADGRAAYASRSAPNRKPGKTVLTVRP